MTREELRYNLIDALIRSHLIPDNSPNVGAIVYIVQQEFDKYLKAVMDDIVVILRGDNE